MNLWPFFRCESVSGKLLKQVWPLCKFMLCSKLDGWPKIPLFRSNPDLFWVKPVKPTVDGRNPAPGNRWFIPGFQPSKVVQDFFHPQYVFVHDMFLFWLLQAMHRRPWRRRGLVVVAWVVGFHVGEWIARERQWFQWVTKDHSLERTDYN